MLRSWVILNHFFMSHQKQRLQALTRILANTLDVTQRSGSSVRQGVWRRALGSAVGWGGGLRPLAGRRLCRALSEALASVCSVQVTQAPPLSRACIRWWWDHNLPARCLREEGRERARHRSSEKAPQQLARNSQIQRKASCFLPRTCQANTREWQVPRAVGQAGLLSSQRQQEQKLKSLPGTGPVATL